MFRRLIGLALKRLYASTRTRLRVRDWCWVAASLAGTAAVSLPFGFATGFLDANHAVKERSLVVQGCLWAFIAPGVVEEALFRAALLPHPATDPAAALRPAAFACRSALPLAVFVAYHLLNPRAESRLVFYDSRFLFLSAVLGTACTVSYWATGGSLLAAAVTHWLPVCVWLFGLGGFQRLQYTRPGS